MSKFTAQICSFTEGLDEMPKKDQKSIRKVLGYLSKRNRFSVFEATANEAIASTMNAIEQAEYIKRTGGQYPWCNYEITDKGREFLSE